jgi:NTE family protein
VSKAIVLSGGGSVGIAWQMGLLAGLAAEGVDVSKADFVLGTSAGSAVGAQLALGHDLGRALERFERRPPSDRPAKRDASAPRPAPSNGSQERLQKLMAIMAGASTPGGDPAQGRAALGRYALEAETVTEDAFMRGFGYLAECPWPRGFACTAVDTESGAFMVWNEASRVPLQRAVASSCSVPGLFPPITLQGRRYMDGGMRSGTNADLAKGHERVLIVTLMSGALGGDHETESDNPRLARMRRNAERELSALQESGARVERVGLDRESAAVIGIDLMNPRLAYDAALAGLRQGKAEAARLREFWS